jgi:hypothetical protein
MLVQRLGITGNRPEFVALGGRCGGEFIYIKSISQPPRGNEHHAQWAPFVVLAISEPVFKSAFTLAKLVQIATHPVRKFELKHHIEQRWSRFLGMRRESRRQIDGDSVQVCRRFGSELTGLS